MMKCRRALNTSFRVHQQGLATLIFSLLILLLAALVTFYTSSAVHREQQLGNNNQRATAAFEAAEAGLAAALAYISDDRDRDDDEVIDPVFDTDADGTGDSDSSAVGGGSVTVTTTVNGLLINLQSTGFSDDRSAVQSVSQIISVTDPLPNDPANPLISRGTVAVEGSATVHNPEGLSTVWSGGEVNMESNNSSHTFVPDVGDGAYPTCMDTPMTCSTVESSSKLSVGLDVIENDSSLGNLSSSEMFRNFFGMAPEAYRSSMVTLETTPAAAEDDVELANHEVIWIEGDTELKNVTVGCTERPTANDTCDYAGGLTKPSIVIINGDATFNGMPNLTGLVFVMGDVYLSGSTTIQGALVVAGEFAETTGSLDVWYNSGVLDDLENAGGRVAVAGTWKDF